MRHHAVPERAQREAVCGGEGSLERGGPAIASEWPAWAGAETGGWSDYGVPGAALRGPGSGGVGLGGGAIKTGKTGDPFHLF